MEWIAGKLRKLEISNYINNKISVGYTLYGTAKAIEYLGKFAEDHTLTDAEAKEYVRMLHRRQTKADKMPLVLI